MIVSAVLAVAFMAPPGTVFATTTCSYGGYNPFPTVTNVVPDRGTIAGGTIVTISGTNFTNGGLVTSVSFGGTPATSFVVVNDTTITAVTPAHAVGVVDVQVTKGGCTSPVSAQDKYHFLPQAVFKPHAPLRLLDTRITHQTLHSGRSLLLHIGGGTPANATAVTLNVTATNTSAAGFLTVFPSGAVRPTASNLNWVRHETVPNLVVVAIGDSGDVTFYNGPGGTVDIVVDLEGWFEPLSTGTAGEFKALQPARITDTRTGSGQPNAGSPLGPGGTLNVLVAPAGGVPGPTGAESVILNITVTHGTKSSVLTAYPTGSTLPTASNLNWTAHKNVANRVSVPIGAGGMVTLHNGSGSVDVIVDVSGYFTDATASGAMFYPLTSHRILDTRTGLGGTNHKVGPQQTIVVTVAGQGGVPPINHSTVNMPTAVIINVTATRPTALSFLTVYPHGTPRPNASDLNFASGQTVPNLVVILIPADGEVSVFNASGSVDVIFDVVGWFDCNAC